MNRETKKYAHGEYFKYTSPNWNGKVIVSLHGLSEVGTDINKVENIGIPFQIKNGLETDYMVLAPQIRWSSGWWPSNMDALFAAEINALNLVKKPVITGISLGGKGVFEMLMSRPDLFSIGAAVAGQCDKPYLLDRVNDPIRAWHGRTDNVFDFTSMEKAIKTLQGFGIDASLIPYDAGHGIWQKAYDPNDPESFWKWLSVVDSDEQPAPSKKFKVTIDQGEFLTDSFKIE